MSWLLRFRLDPNSASDSLSGSSALGFSDVVSSLLWDSGTTGLFEDADGVWVAGYQTERAAQEALAHLTRSLGTVLAEHEITEYRFAGNDEWSTVELPGGAEPLRLRSGTLFGHGHHPTTQLALQLLAKRLRPGARVLDVGAGTGVLSLAAHRLGAGSVTAVEIEPEAAAVIATNLAANDLPADAVQTQIASISDLAGELDRYDLVVANVLLPVHRLLVEHLAGLLAPTWDVIASGVVHRHRAELEALYRHALPRPAPITAIESDPAERGDDFAKDQTEDQWIALVVSNRERSVKP